jgi:hypothetical protein
MPVRSLTLGVLVSVAVHAGLLGGWSGAARVPEPEHARASVWHLAAASVNQEALSKPAPDNLASAASGLRPAGRTSLPERTPQAPVCRAAEMLEQAPVPVSAPDVSRLDQVELPGSSLRLRLQVDEAGRVREVAVLRGAEGDWSAVRNMLMATAFTPGRLAGKPVLACLDIEINISELLRLI